MRRVVSAIAALIVLVAAALNGGAAESPTAQDLVERLKPASVATRGFVPRGVTVEAPAGPAAPPSVDLQVNFEFNSATLSTDAALTLNQLGQALNDPALASFRFQVAGHTDGVGSAAFNQTLSAQRAAAVKDYLVTHHGVAADRLETVGYGKSRLLDPAHPDAAVNRRVQVTNVGG